MAIDFNKTFGSTAPKSTSKADLPKAQFWINIGYTAEIDTDDGVEKRFISLPMGIPVDTQEKLPTNSSNVLWAMQQAARNDLMEQIMEAAKTLKPGEEAILKLEVQLRHVRDEAPAATAENNQFVRKLALL